MVTGTAGEVELRTMRISFIWHQNLMADEKRARPQVLDLEAYDALFNSRVSAVHDGLRVPWPTYERQGFWEKYLAKPDDLPAVTPRNARRALLPLRLERMPGVGGFYSGLPGVASEGFLHSWGASLIVTFAVRASWSFSDSADFLLSLRRDKWLRLEGESEPQRLDDVASRGLEYLRTRAKLVANGQRSAPFSVFSLISAAGDRARFALGDSTSEVSRFLHAVTSFRDTWAEDQPPDPEQARVAGFRAGPAEHMTYGSSRGRAIWSPGNFLAKSGKEVRTLGCHHRNLVLASMQTEALGGYARDTARRLAGGIALSGEHSSQCDDLCKNLKQLFDGADSTYKSGSVKAQIAAGWKADIDSVCRFRRLPELG